MISCGCARIPRIVAGEKGISAKILMLKNLHSGVASLKVSVDKIDT